MKKVLYVCIAIMLLLFSFMFLQNGFTMGQPPSEDIIRREAKKKMRTVKHLMNSQPSPKINYSMDRFLLTERLVRFNDPSKMTYLYINFPSGEWIQFTIVGKVASTGKRLTPPVKNYKVDKGSIIGTDLGPAPDEMGVYGHSSGSAKVGLSTIGSIFEFGGFVAFIYSEVPLNFKNMNDQMIEVEVKVSPEERAELGKKLKHLQNSIKNKK